MSWTKVSKSRPVGRRNSDQPVISKRTRKGYSAVALYMPASWVEAPYVAIYRDGPRIGFKWSQTEGFTASGNKNSNRRSVNIPRDLHDLIPEGYQPVRLTREGDMLVLDTTTLVETGAIPEEAPEPDEIGESPVAEDMPHAEEGETETPEPDGPDPEPEEPPAPEGATQPVEAATPEGFPEPEDAPQAVEDEASTTEEKEIPW